MAKSVQPRGERVVRRALDAAVDELSKVGYASLRIDDVARRAGVNKTTVYRRWPTKEALVRAALLSLAERHGGLVVPDTGDVRGDLLALLEQKLRFARSPEGSAMIRVLEEGSGDAELMAIVRSLRAARDVVLRTVLERARARGALRTDVDVALMMDVIQTSCDRARRQGGRVPSHFVKGLVDLLLQGAARNKRNSQLRT